MHCQHFFSAVILRLLLRFIAGRLAVFAARTDTRLDDAVVQIIRQTKWWLLAAIGFYAASRFIAISDWLTEWIEGIATVALFIQVGIWMSGTITTWLETSRQRRLANSPAAATGLVAIVLWLDWSAGPSFCCWY